MDFLRNSSTHCVIAFAKYSDWSSLWELHVKGKDPKIIIHVTLHSEVRHLTIELLQAALRVEITPCISRDKVTSTQTLIIQPHDHQNKLTTLLRGVRTDTERGVLLGLPKSAICVQRFDDSLNSAIRITYRISLRSSSLREPRYPLLRVVFYDSYNETCRILLS